MLPGSTSTINHLHHHYTTILNNYKTTAKNHINKTHLNKHEHEHEHKHKHKHEHEHKKHKPMYKPPPFKPPPTTTPTPSTNMPTNSSTLTAVTPTPMPGAASLLNDDYEYEYTTPHYYYTTPHTYTPTYTPPHSYTPHYKPPPPSYPTTYIPPPAYATTYPHKPPQYFDPSYEKIHLPILFYPTKNKVYEEEDTFSSDDVLCKNVASKGRNWCRNHKLICSVCSTIRGISFW